MKIILLSTLLGMIMQPNQWNSFKPKVNLESEFGITSSELFGYEEESEAVSQNKIYFNSGVGYFITYKKDNNDVLGSILFEPSKNGWKINTCYVGNYVPFKNDECFFVSPEYFVTFKEKINLVNAIYDDTGITFGSTIDPTRYFPVSGSVSSHLHTYTASYLQEAKILKVPNYMNTQFNNNGCTPTTAAMNFAYLEDNGLNIINNSSYKNLPLKHTDDRTKVDNFILYLGNNYFKTDFENGSDSEYYPTAYNEYLDSTDYYDYSYHASNNYNEYKNAILNASNPIHISLHFYYGKKAIRHSALGIGYKEIHQSNGNITRLINSNRALEDEMVEFYYNSDYIVNFHFLYK